MIHVTVFIVRFLLIRYLFGNLRESTTGDALDLSALFSNETFRERKSRMFVNSSGGCKAEFLVRSSALIRGKSTRNRRRCNFFKDEKRRLPGTPSRERFDSQPVWAPRSSLLRGFRSESVVCDREQHASESAGHNAHARSLFHNS